MKRRNRYSTSDIFVADTHALLWYLTEDKKLGIKAQEVFEKAD
jgi:PIN domain nuclease of toxin-antitoxin system